MRMRTKMASAQVRHEQDKIKKIKRSCSPESVKTHSTKHKKTKAEDKELTPEKTKWRIQDRHLTKKTKKDKKKPSHSSSKHKVRNITELAKLVSSGKVNVPQSLVNYTEERLVLLDQLFTILTPDDVRGMLPDILKDLKIKEVKQLCYEQLKNMDSEEVKKAITGECRQPKDDEEEEEEDEEKRQIGVKEILELTEDLEDSSEKREASTNDSCSSRELSCTRMRENDSANVRLSPSAEQETPKEGYQLCVSDVSEGESSEGDIDQGEARERFSTLCMSQDASILAAPVRTRDSGPQTPSEDKIELTAGSPAGDIDRELYEEPVEEEESVCVNEQDCCSLESSQAMEMLLRQRALEAVLRRNSRTSGGSEPCGEVEEGGQQAREEEEDEESPPQSPGDCDELEQKLRLRALQSMFSKQRTS